MKTYLHLYRCRSIYAFALESTKDALGEFEVFKASHRSHQMGALHDDVELIPDSLILLLRLLTQLGRQLPPCED